MPFPHRCFYPRLDVALVGGWHLTHLLLVLRSLFEAFEASQRGRQAAGSVSGLPLRASVLKVQGQVTHPEVPRLLIFFQPSNLHLTE